MPKPQKLTFARFGRALHLRIGSAADLANVVELDEAHWVATSAPVNTLRCDETFLKLVDADGRGRIRASEMQDAITWLFDVLSQTAGVTEASAVLKLDTINGDHDDGQRILQSAQKMLASLNQADTAQISLDQVRRIKAGVESAEVSAAGVALPGAAEDASVRQFMMDIIATIGGAAHPSGQHGIALEQLDGFVSQVKAYLDWLAVPQKADRGDLLPLGDDTASAHAVLARVRDKLDQYFGQCAAVAFDQKLSGRMPPRDLHQTDLSDPSAIEALIEKAPLAKPRPDRTLDLSEPINRHYAAALEALCQQVLQPGLDAKVTRLAEGQWSQIKKRFVPYEAWINAKPPDAVAALGAQKLQAYGESDMADKVRTLISRSHETTLELDSIRLVEKLVLYQAYLIDLANNYVSFPDLYDPQNRAMFEMGTLVMDGRRFNLAVKVENRTEHAKVTAASSMFVLYVEVSGPKGMPPTVVALPVTSEGKGNLVVGKRGVFEDVDGQQWDARVVAIIENPISIGEALIAPFIRVGRLVSGKIEQMTSAAEKQLDTSTQQAMTQVQTAPGPAPAPAPPPPSAQSSAQTRGMLAGGVLAGGGLAVAAVGSALTYLAKEVPEHGLTLLLVVGGALLAVLLPTAVLAFIKLRRRDLSAILEGSGWAINARMRLTRAQSRQFTQRPAYPRGARGVGKVRRWLVGLLVVVCCAAIAYGGFRIWEYFDTFNAQPEAPAENEPGNEPD